MKNQPVKPITVQELINFLNTVKNKQTVVGVSIDSEGNGFSLIPNQLFYSPGYMENHLGYNDLEEEKINENLVPAIILWPSN